MSSPDGESGVFKVQNCSKVIVKLLTNEGRESSVHRLIYREDTRLSKRGLS